MKVLNSMRARMTVAVTLAFAIWMLVICIGVILHSRHLALIRVDHRLQVTINEIADDLLQVAGNNVGAIDQLSDATLDNITREDRVDLLANNMALLLIDAHGHVMKQSQVMAPLWPRNAINSKDEWIVKSTPAGRGRLLVVGYNWRQVRERFDEEILQLLLVSLGVLVAVAFGSWVLVGRTLSPISLLSRQARNASTESLRLRLLPSSPDVEIVELVGTFNNLLSRLRETAVAKGRFYAAASHELRTPLQALSGHLEVALSRQRSVEECRTTLEEAHAQTRRLISLTRDLLFLNQLETAAKLPESEHVSISEICERDLRTLHPLIAQHQLHVTTELEADGSISAPPTHAAMLIRNIVENAVKYATSAGELRITVREEQEGVRVEVFNSYPPSLEWNAELLFEPFYRPDASRNAKTGGNGLGLAICKAIVIANGWQMTLEHTGAGVLASLLLTAHGEKES